MKKALIILGILFFIGKTYSQTAYPNNEDGEFEDMITPEYYLSENGSAFRNEVNKFVYFVRKEQFRHPLETPTGYIPEFTIPDNGKFGAGKGPTGTQQHHAASDFHVGNNETKVTLYADYDGYVHTYRDSPKYRHYLTITKDITDDDGISLGKLVTIYAHIDLDLDEAASLSMDGQSVNKGDIVSENLYSGTVGGPHLHFEIRFYRPTEEGTEIYYEFVGPEGSTTLTEPSAGSWTYGYWNPNIGYGFGDPANYLTNTTNDIPDANFNQAIQIFPNPATNNVFINCSNENSKYSVLIYSITGTFIEQQEFEAQKTIAFDVSEYKSGMYFLQLINETEQKQSMFKIIKQ